MRKVLSLGNRPTLVMRRVDAALASASAPTIASESATRSNRVTSILPGALVARSCASSSVAAHDPPEQRQERVARGAGRPAPSRKHSDERRRAPLFSK
jgi:hypothetical protein